MAIGMDARSTFLAVVKGDASQAVTEFKKLGNSVEKSTKQANTSVGKFKTMTNGAMAEVKANAGMLAAGAGAALGAFAVSTATQFADLGVAVGKFSDATGLALEDASRWVEVSSDLGVETSALQASLNKLNREIDPEKFRELGVQIAYTKDGATDVNGTFLNVIDRLNEIRDPAERARVATKLLGRNWMELSELIGRGSDRLRDSLDSVSDAKIYTPEERKKAEQFRDTMADLSDVYEDFVMKIGVIAAPIMSDMADRLISIAGAAEKVASAFNSIRNSGPVGFVEDLFNVPADMVGTLSSGIDVLTDGAGEFEIMGHKFKITAEQVEDAGAASDQAARYVDFLADRADAAAKATRDLAAAEKHAYDRTRDLRQAMLDLNEIQLDAYEAQADIVTMSLEAMQAQQDYNDAVKEGEAPVSDLAIEAHDLAVAIADIDKKQQEANNGTQTAAERNEILMGKYNELQSTLEPGSPLWNAIQMYKDAILSIPTERVTRLSVTTASGRPGATTSNPAVGLGPDGERSATLPPVGSGRSAVLPASGGTTVVQVFPRVMPTERELTDAINGVRRRQGNVI